MFGYENNLPSLEPFPVTFEVQDPRYGFSHIAWMYDTIGNQVTSAIRRGSGGSDVLV